MLGVDMTDEIGAVRGNENGQWERLEIVDLHDRILALFGRGYWTPQHDLPLPPGWWADPRLRPLQREIAGCFERQLASETLFGFKDPRTARLLPMWRQIFDELNLVPKIVLCLRNPAQVARSLHDRDGLDLELGEFRWFTYMADIFRNVDDQQICTIEYETWFDNPDANLEKLMRFLNIRWRQSDADLRMALADIVDQRLRHDTGADLSARHPLVRSFYTLARSFADDPAARERIEYIVNHFITYQHLHGPLHREFDRAWTKQEAISAERVAEAAALRDELAARDAALAEANRRAEEIAAALAPVQAQTEEREAALARAEAISRECAAEAAALRDHLAARDAALAEANHRAEETSARVAEVLAERAQTDIALARAQQEAALRNAAVEAAQQELVAARDELAARDAAFAEANHRAEETTAALASAQAQLEEREAALARAEAISAERLAEAAALRDELAARDAALAKANHRPRRSQ